MPLHLSLSFHETDKWKLTQFQAKHRVTPLRPRVNPAGPVGLGPVILSEAAPLSERGKAQGPGPRSLAARRTDPTGVPTLLGRSREIPYLNSAAPA